jgi:hypothetical protein
MTAEKRIEIQAPYVSVKVTKVVGGRSPKTEITMKASGAIDEIKIVDVEVTLSDLREKILDQINRYPLPTD